MRGVTNWYNEKPYDDRIQISPAVTAIESASRSPKSVYEALTTGKNKKRAIKDVLTLIGLLSGLPVGALGRPLGYVADVEEGKTRPKNAAEFGQGLATGHTRRQ